MPLKAGPVALAHCSEPWAEAEQKCAGRSAAPSPRGSGHLKKKPYFSGSSSSIVKVAVPV